ncbi:MAG: hypothetical protein FWG32_00745, partial [Oscillospiraceae bacterium]|nr:hypothetical protein [Oscillospiraceae bacterium]
EGTGIMRKVLAVIAIAIIMVFSSCASDNPEVEIIEGIFHPVYSLGYNIQLKRNDIIYSAYVTASGRLSADGSVTTLDVPYGKKIGLLIGNEAMKNERFPIYEVEGYSPDEWLYFVYGPDGSRGIVLYKADGVADIPELFERLKIEEELS